MGIEGYTGGDPSCCQGLTGAIVQGSLTSNVRILFDNGVPNGLRDYLAQHEVEFSRDLGWAMLSNGMLLQRGAESGYELLITNDTRMAREQNLPRSDIAVLLIWPNRWRTIEENVNQIIATIDAMQHGQYRELRF